MQTIYVRKGTSWLPFGWMCLACQHVWPRSLAALDDDPPEAWKVWLEREIEDPQRLEAFAAEVDRLEQRQMITRYRAAELRSLARPVDAVLAEIGIRPDFRREAP